MIENENWKIDQSCALPLKISLPKIFSSVVTLHIVLEKAILPCAIAVWLP